jgi:PAS domain S-box-containing protein
MLREVSDEFDLQHVDRLEAALDHLGRAAVDVVLLDLGLPDSDGLETVVRARQRATHKPIVVLSGVDDEDVAREAVRQGAQDYLVKGRIEGRGLARVIRLAIERQRTETRLSEILRAALDAHVLMDAAGSITGWNPQAEAVFGWAPAEVLGRPLADIIVPPAMRERHRKGLRHFLATGVGPILNQRIELTAIRKDGREFPVELAVTPIKIRDEWSFSAFLRDITDRKGAEDALRRSEERYRVLFDTTPAPMWVYDLETLRILAVNDAAAVQYGYSRAEFLAMTIEQLRPPEEIPRLRELLARGSPPGSEPGASWTHKRKDGSRLTVEIFSHALLFEGRQARLVVANDVSHRERAQEALAERTRVAELGAEIGAALTKGSTLSEMLNGCCEALVRNLDAAFARIWTLNELQQTLELQASAGLYTHLDGPHSRVAVGQYKIGLIASERRPHVTNTVIGDPRVGDQEWAKREGMVAFAGYPLLVQGQVVGVVAMFARHPWTPFVSDALATVADSLAVAIERKRAEQALRTSEQRARTLFETLHLIVLGLDVYGIVNYVNPFLLELTGFTADELIGSSWFDRVLPPAERQGGHAAFLQQLESNAHAHYQNTIVTKSGKERTIAWSNTVLHDASGHPTGTLSIGEDTTERALLEQQLRQGQKMEAIGRLAGGIAHDFNNLLTAIFGYSDLLAEELPADSPGREDLQEIKTAATRAAALTRQLLAFSRQQVLQPVVLNVNDVIENLESMLRRVLGEDVELETHLSADIGNAKADPGQLEQVIMNLAVNARDAMPTGGKLTIETTNVSLSGDYAESHRPVASGEYIMLAVSDTGIGMDETVKTRLFEPFFTTKGAGTGTGLGLATVYGIVKQSGGYIWVYSELGHGATFKVYLPRVRAPLEEAKKEVPTTGTLEGTETILLAEDEDLLRPLARALLTKLGYRVLEANNAAAALEVARTHPGEIHLLISDVVMPGQSGLQLARQLAPTRPGMKVLFMSGYTDEAIVRHGLLDPGTNFLQKPFTPAMLTRKVREVLDALPT